VNAPGVLSAVLERAGQALRLFKMGDGGLAAFNGTREETAALVELVLTQGQAKTRAPLQLEESGFHRLQAGRAVVVCDAGAPPPARPPEPATGLPRGADRFAHAGTLSFEMSVGRERLVVNCGAAPAAESGWRDALRATAAHSTLVLAETNSSELRDEGLGGRRPERVTAERHEAEGAQWLEAAHDGWRRPFGAVHRRRLYLSQNGEDLRGEDILEMQGPETPLPSFLLRFHLHPEVAANPQEDGESVLLRLPSGQGWRLRSKGARATLEESVHLAGEARRSSQVVLRPEAGADTVQWAITRVLPASEEDA
jgi:uncharacterized heparinase superfamily protein